MARGKADEAEVKSEVRAHGRPTEPTLAAVDALDVDSIVLGLCSDVRPLGGLMAMVDWRLCGRLSHAIEAGTINPNSRPRAEDLSATCASIALAGIEPDASIRQRIERARAGLADPW